MFLVQISEEVGLLLDGFERPSAVVGKTGGIRICMCLLTRQKQSSYGFVTTSDELLAAKEG